MDENNFEEKILVPWDPLRVPRVPILGPAREIFSKLNGPCPLRSGGHSHTSFSIGEFWAAQRTLGSDVEHDLSNDIFFITDLAVNAIWKVILHLKK